MPSPFAEVLDSLRGSFEALDADWYVFGAQAALVHGAVRMTADVDVTVFPGDHSIEKLLKGLVQEAGSFDYDYEGNGNTYAENASGDVLKK